MLSSVAQLSDQELLARVKRLAAREREATASLLAHLAELDERRLYLAEGCSSLFTYCTQVLHLSEHAAYGRIEAARAGRRFPVILEMLCDGSVNLTTVGLLATHLTHENHREVLDGARHKRQPVSTPLPDQAALTVLASAPWLAGLYGVRSCQQRQSTRIQALARMRTACG